MAINYLPNDPLAGDDSPLRRVAPRADRPSGRAGFFYNEPVPEGIYPVGTPEFLFWQCSEAALAALATWEKLAGPLERWANDHERLLEVSPGLWSENFIEGTSEDLADGVRRHHGRAHAASRSGRHRVLTHVRVACPA